MRVIAGEFGGRKLAGPKWTGLRPTTDLVRAAMWNMLQSYCTIEDAHIVDMCAGTGACGIEALSRGARFVDFVDSDRRACALIQRNIHACLPDAAASSAKIHCETAERYVARCDATNITVICIDPPYAYTDAQWKELAAMLYRQGATLLCCESDRTLQFDPQEWAVVKSKRFGETFLTLCERLDA